jgi:Fe2+ transport system protein FeoA
MAVKPLSELKPESQSCPGERGKVVRVSGDAGVRRRIMDMGIVRGAEIQMLRVAPPGDPVEVAIKGYNLTLRKIEAENVYVEVKS